MRRVAEQVDAIARLGSEAHVSAESVQGVADEMERTTGTLVETLRGSSPRPGAGSWADIPIRPGDRQASATQTSCQFLTGNGSRSACKTACAAPCCGHGKNPERAALQGLQAGPSAAGPASGTIAEPALAPEAARQSARQTGSGGRGFADKPQASYDATPVAGVDPTLAKALGLKPEPPPSRRRNRETEVSSFAEIMEARPRRVMQGNVAPDLPDDIRMGRA